MAERLILCGGAQREGEDRLLLAVSGQSKNITLSFGGIGKELAGNLPGRLIDLIEIASYVCCADQAVSRGDKVQRAVSADWYRSLKFVIPTRDPAHWAKVVRSLRDTLSFLTEDYYYFEFEEETDPVSFQNYANVDDDADPSFNADEVVSFSGELDSLGGVIEELSTKTIRIALVSYHSSPKIFENQKRLIAELKTRFPQRIIHIPVFMIGQQDAQVAQEEPHLSRPFLYATAVCVVAWLFGKSRIRFFQNGVRSINLPIADQVVGARAARSRNPLVLERFRVLLKMVLGELPIEIENPFIWKTKADVIRSIVDRGCGDLIKYAVSCTRPDDTSRPHAHCGCCSECFDRRFAVLAAGAAEYDPVEMYKLDVLTGMRDKSEDVTLAESYVRFALETREMGEHAFFGRFSSHLARVCDGFSFTKADEIAQQVLYLHQRHAQAIEEVLKDAIERHSMDLVKANLPSSSALMMAVTRGETPRLVSIGRRTDPLQVRLEHEGRSGSTDTHEPAGKERERSRPALERSRRVIKEQVEATPESAVGAPERTERRRGKSHPALERARGAISELYPNGDPGQAAEPNVNLYRRVGEKLKQSGLPGVSNDTILRAAGRRK
jgi:Queuosine biosynthesis protein QueC